MRANTLLFAAILGFGAFGSAKADEIQFTTLPDVVRTTVVRQTNIPDYSRVTRVIRDPSGVYEVTVHRDSDDDVLYVDNYGRLVRERTIAVAPAESVVQAPAETVVQAPARTVVQAPVGRVVQQTVTETTEPTADTFIRSLDSARYQLIEKKRNKEVYRDRQTGRKWVVKVDSEDED
jgi:hypothetical protein